MQVATESASTKSQAMVDVALAGLRVGYGAFPLELANYMWRAKQPYNVSVAAEVAVCAALSNKDYMQASLLSRLKFESLMSSCSAREI